MSKLILLFITCICVNWLIATASAQEETTTLKTNEQSQQEDKKQSRHEASGGFKKTFCLLSGCFVGIPVQIGKDIKKETYRMSGTLRQDMGNDFDLVSNTFVLAGAVPYGIISGTILGSIHGSKAVADSLHTPSDSINSNSELAVPIIIKEAPPGN